MKIIENILGVLFLTFMYTVTGSTGHKRGRRYRRQNYR